MEKRSGSSFYNNLMSAVSLVAKEEIADELDEGRLRMPCNAGVKFLVIDDEGALYPCETLGRRLGDLRDHGYDFRSVLKTDEARGVLEFIREGRCFCTIDCNTISNVIFGPSLWWRVVKKLLRFYTAR